MIEIRSDVLVIGSGIAGLSFALKAAEMGTVSLITKKQKAESNTNYAQGGIAAVSSPDDSFDLHIHDTLSAGVGLCHRDAVEILVKEGPNRLKELVHIGVDFTTNKGKLDLGREGGHSRHRIVHSHDRSGSEIERALLHAIAAHPNITVYENHLAIDLVTEHHLGEKLAKDTPVHCWGAYALDVESNIVKTVLTSITVLCSGGLGQAYLHTTNPSIATGDGVAMAFRAGARIGNMEFIQFHPTTLYNSGSPAFLISEAIRGFGGILKTKNGEEFMNRYDERGSLAPRDIVARAIDTELKRKGDEYVLLDLRHLQTDDVKSHFPHIYETCLTKYKLDITNEPIPVVPAAHYSCGGVLTDLNGRTSIQNLYACGEVAMTGVHGANRLASNSLLEAVVFSDRAFRDAQHVLETQRPRVPDIPAWDDSGTFDAEEWVLISHDCREIQEIMWDYVGIVRSDLRLERAQRRLKFIRNEIENFYKRTKVVEGLIELRNLSTVADLIVRCALMRKESRGLHYTTDYPERNDREWLKDTVVTMWE
ncbi:MAG: L-aspartate oxidase [Ignavibacteriae bacterium]|nr:L-aspartate oxidase [Ignavibacteria bacterium]MBI3365504.1 L-aspartate oxidase [Ignavibacteriota bacterium]